jgi:GDPmannose 4,6-dehydratase
VKAAIVVGAAGQDGRLLSDSLQKNGVDVLRLGRRAADRIEALDILNGSAVEAVIERSRPDAIYYLPAFHQSAEDRRLLDPRDLWQKSFATHVTGLINFLEAIRSHAPAARLFYAASSLIFGGSTIVPQDETTPFNPDTVYGVTKATGVDCCRFYRNAYGLFAASGILYNHESKYRPPTFLSQKVIQTALQIRAGRQSELVLGDLSAEADWGYAPDYVEAMTRILGGAQPDDYVIATGIAHTVQDFVSCVFAELGLDWRAHVREEKSIVKSRRARLIGNPAKLGRETGWKPSVSFGEMISRLVRETRDDGTTSTDFHPHV